MSERTINEFIGVSIEKIHSMVDADTMLGNPILCGDGTTVIPVSKVSVGFASGGSDLPTRTAKEYFAGGAGAGMSIRPVGFLVVQNGEVRLMQMTIDADKCNVLLEKLPEVIDKFGEMLSKNKKDKSEKKEKAVTDADSIEAEAEAEMDSAE